MRSASSHGDFVALQPGFSDRVGKPRVLETGTDSEVQVSPPVRYGGPAVQSLASFLLPNSADVGEEASPQEEVSLKDMFKTIDPTTSPFC